MMTNEQREALVEQVEAVVFEVMQQGVPKDVMDETAYGFTCRIIALVEADVARRLLGWDAVRAAVDVMDDRTGFHEEEYAADTLREALAAIGIEPREDGEG